MAGGSCLQFSVHRCKPMLVSPAKPTPYELKQLSEIDCQDGLRFHVPVFAFYSSNDVKYPSSSSVDFDGRSGNINGCGRRKLAGGVIRDALSQALVYYYPLAGRIRESPDGKKLIVECTGEGVKYTEAEADVRLEEFGERILPPIPCDHLLFEKPSSPDDYQSIMSIQVTHLLCGGFILAVMFNHTVMDGEGLGQFLSAVGEIARGAKTPSVVPVWERQVLKARQPPRVTDAHYEYEINIINTNYNIDAAAATLLDDLDYNLGAAAAAAAPLWRASFFFGRAQLAGLIRNLLLPPHLKQYSSSTSTYEIITACLWRCRTLALNPDPTASVRLICVMSGRRRRGLLSQKQYNYPVGYYGNLIACVGIVTTAEKLCTNPLGYAVELVKEAKAKMNEVDCLQSQLDFLALHNKPPFLLTPTTFIVSDNTRLLAAPLDFGWGRHLYYGPIDTNVYINSSAAASHFSVLAAAHCSVLVRSTTTTTKDAEEDGIVSHLCFPKPFMERFLLELQEMTCSAGPEYAKL